VSSPEPSEAESPPVDTSAAIEHAYRFHRAKRRVREKRQQRKRVAGLRFYTVLTALVFFAVVLGLTVWNEIQRLFGL
jgi:hypothetical protein